MKTILEVIIALLIAIPLGLFVIFDLPGLGIVLAMALISFAYVMKKNHEEILAGHQPLIVSRTEHHKKAA